jgi:hypothetical protein
MSLENFQIELVDRIFSQDTTQNSLYQHSHLYRQNIFLNLMTHLKHLYPLSLTLLGEDLFNKIAHHYIGRYPSLSSTINEYGEYFPDDLADYPGLLSFPYLFDLAQFEWAIHVVSLAADASRLDIKLLDKISLEKYSQVHVMLHPASLLKIFRYSILDIVNACHRQHYQRLINIKENPTYVLIIRPEIELSYVNLTLAEFTFLSCLNDNQSLSAAQAAATAISNDFKLEEKLINWIQEKIIVDIIL